MDWGKGKAKIYIGLQNPEILAAQAGSRKTSMLNLHDLRSPTWVFPIRHHGCSFTFLTLYSGAVEIVRRAET